MRLYTQKTILQSSRYTHQASMRRRAECPARCWAAGSRRPWWKRCGRRRKPTFRRGKVHARRAARRPDRKRRGRLKCDGKMCTWKWIYKSIMRRSRRAATWQISRQMANAGRTPSPLFLLRTKNNFFQLANFIDMPGARGLDAGASAPNFIVKTNPPPSRRGLTAY